MIIFKILLNDQLPSISFTLVVISTKDLVQTLADIPSAFKNSNDVLKSVVDSHDIQKYAASNPKISKIKQLVLRKNMRIK